MYVRANVKFFWALTRKSFLQLREASHERFDKVLADGVFLIRLLVNVVLDRALHGLARRLLLRIAYAVSARESAMRLSISPSGTLLSSRTEIQ